MFTPSTIDNTIEARLVHLTKVWLNGPVHAKEEAFHALMKLDHPKALSVVREVVTQRSSRLNDYAVDYQYAFSDALREEYKAILALNDSKWTNRCSAAQMMRGIRTQSGKRALLARYKAEQHPIVRRDIACALGYWNESKIIDFLKIALTKENHLSGRIGCLEGLVRCGELGYLPEYLGLLQHEDALVRHQVVNSLGNNHFQLHDRLLVTGSLIDLLEKEDQSGVRGGIATALKRINEG